MTNTQDTPTQDEVAAAVLIAAKRAAERSLQVSERDFTDTTASVAKRWADVAQSLAIAHSYLK
jgi:hypothetical protein